MLNNIIDFKNMLDLRPKKTPQQAFGLYVVALMVMLILFAFSLMVIEAGEGFQEDTDAMARQIRSTGWFLGLLLSVPLSIIINSKKKLQLHIGGGLVVLTFALTFISGIFALAVPAFMSAMEPNGS